MQGKGGSLSGGVENCRGKWGEGARGKEFDQCQALYRDRKKEKVLQGKKPYIFQTPSGSRERSGLRANGVRRGN